MGIISRITARQILDSRGNPTVEADVILEDGSIGRAASPSGASTGSREALELRDGGKRYGGKGVLQAVTNVHDHLGPALVGRSVFDQTAIDDLMRQMDGTDDKSRMGANAILAVSLAAAKAAAISKGVPLYEHIAELAGTEHEMSLPLPMMNIMNGGAHAGFATDIQEYMVMPIGAQNFSQCLEMGAGVFHALAKLLHEQGQPTTVGDEGGYAPKLPGGNRAPLDIIMQAIEKAGYTPGKDIAIALDVAASEFAHADGYHLRADDKTLPSSDMISWLESLADDYPIISIEDGLGENDWDNWSALTQAIGNTVQVVGDDLLVTNPKLLQSAIEQRSANAILIKPNQIGTLSETIQAVMLAKKHGFRTIMSHRSGETEDTTIAHLAVGLGTGQIKTGSLSRSERIAKYNEILRISEANSNIILAPWQTQ